MVEVRTTPPRPELGVGGVSRWRSLSRHGASSLRRLGAVWVFAAPVFVAPVLGACEEQQPPPDESPLVVVPAAPAPSAPRLLYLPDGGDRAPPEAPELAPRPALPQAQGSSRCPAEMVDIAGRFCIDRYEAQLVDSRAGRMLSPYYSPVPRKAKREFGVWRTEALQVGSQQARAKPVPLLPGWQMTEDFEPKAQSVAGVVPNGYMTAYDAERACVNAGKRLCSEQEWVTACQGEKQQQFPYGNKYEWKRCNVFREAHPAAVLHDDASRGHLDPRLNQVSSSAGPLLRKTGETLECKSTWGADAVYDMVGNLDEWIDDPNGVFVGGFFSRSTKHGCLSRVGAHPREYYDYSLGVRCCRPQ